MYFVYMHHFGCKNNIRINNCQWHDETKNRIENIPRIIPTSENENGFQPFNTHRKAIKLKRDSEWRTRDTKMGQ